MRRHRVVTGICATFAAALLLAWAPPLNAQEGTVPFSKMTVEGGVLTDEESGASMLSFEVDFTLGEESDGIAVGEDGDSLRIETSIGMVPGPQAMLMGAGLMDKHEHALRLDIEVQGDCFERRGNRFLVALGDRKEIAGCVQVTLQTPDSGPIPLGLLQSMEINLWRRGRPDRWRMRSKAAFDPPPFGFPVAGFGPGSWTGLVIGDDAGRVATSAVGFEGGSHTAGRP